MAVASQGGQKPELRKVNSLIRASGREDDALISFADLFFSGGDSDFEGYSENSLATLVLAGWELVASHKPGTHKIRIENPAGPGSSHGDITIVEILNDDMPFLVDSVMGEIQERGLAVQLVSHPVFHVLRGADNAIEELAPSSRPGPPGSVRESYIHIHLDHIESASDRAALKQALGNVLDHVRIVVKDWKPMQDRLHRSIAAYTNQPPPVPVTELAESIEFLRWLLDDNFTFLGMRALAFVGGEARGHLEPVPNSGLGLLRDEDVYVLSRGGDNVHMTPEIRQFFLAPAPLIVTKANMRSDVHRRVYMDYIGVKIYADSGEISGELRIVGLFTSTAYTRSTQNIPFLRHKADLVMRRSGYLPGSHSGKALDNILETFPRDELFQIDVEQLYDTAMGILSLELRPRTRVFARIDKFDRFVSILVYVPRDRFATGVRQRVGDFFAETFNGHVSAYYLFFPEGPLVRMHYIIGRSEGETPRHGNDALEEAVDDIIRTWPDILAEQLHERPDGALLAAKYGSAFSGSYQAALTAERAVEDISHFEKLTAESPIAIRFYRDPEGEQGRAHVAIYHREGPIPLSRRVPVLENLGFAVIHERSYAVAPEGARNGSRMSLHDMVLETDIADEAALRDAFDRLEKCFLAIWEGVAGNDAYNRLVLACGFDWREAAAMRGYGTYLRQIGAPFGQAYLAETLRRHAGVTRDLMALYRYRFDPASGMGGAGREEQQEKLVRRIEEALEHIPSLDEDRIIRHFRNLIATTTRTNFYQRDDDGLPRPTIAFKLDSKKVEGSPSPRPFAEIFVFSPRVEGIHLRGGRIARGGLRWSDRAQDFRTEVLSLAKAQQVKNVVIVPTGSKGGFVPKMLPQGGAREDVLAEGVAAYRLFVSSLFDITDNLEDGKVAPPKQVVRHDGDDPYLVVAADKGTASFSDYANEISIAHDFWLGDAFASGGSAGYDHKKMGVTARGAWEAVKRHFREMDRDIQSEPFTVIGIGDMSGDVFGNGMLLSKEIRLLAAFDHRDIFIDPDPDSEAGWKERKRLFEMPRSSWQDYDSGLISEGGGVFSRSAKSVPLSKQIRTMLGVDAVALTPHELMRAILRAEADLLWFGGIGTYVAAAHETVDQIGDRANDPIRVTSRELRVKVVGEGANLGMTQAGRIDFARRGGRGNTDAIDNSAGVNSSDLEVNIKIALGAAVAVGKIGLAERNSILAGMTEEVAERCLRNNYLQSLAISLGERNGVADIGFQGRLMRALERDGQLDREIEHLPDDAELEERRMTGAGLTRPELAVLLAYSKIDLYEELVASDVPDDPFFADELFTYFPQTLRRKFPDEIEAHRLRREIIATRLSNLIINRGGSTMFVRLKEETGHTADTITLAFTAAQAIFGLRELFDGLDALDNKVPGMFQIELYCRLQGLLRQKTAWFLRHADLDQGLSELTEQYSAGVREIGGSLEKIVSADRRAAWKADIKVLEEGGVPAPLARSLALLRILSDAPEIVLVSQKTGIPVLEVASVYSDAADYFRLGTLKTNADALLVSDYFDRLAINATIGNLSAAQRGIAEEVVGKGDGSFEEWLEKNRGQAERIRRSLDEILDGEFTLSKLMVAVGHLAAAGKP